MKQRALIFIILIIAIVMLSTACNGQGAGKNTTDIVTGDSGESARDRNNSDSISSMVLPPFKADADMQERVGNRISGGGYIEEYAGQFYFANQKDSNKLYRMDVSDK